MTRLHIADPRTKPRDTLGRYELVRELAFGRFYSVYLARAKGDARSVVIKRLRTAHPESYARARMLREARVGMGMRVPQLARVLEICDEPELFVVMEYVEGTPLSELLAKARGKDVLRFVLPVLLDTLRALSALHNWKDETGAPGYLVHQAPSARHLLVGLDGVTRLVDLSNLHGRLLGAMPSAQYTLMDSELAPEQAARVGLDPRCDLYIVGAVLRHALAQSGRTNVPGLLEVCERATSLRPADRYWSADELGHALEFAASEADLLAPPEQVARWVRQSRASLIAATATAPRVKLTLPAPSPELAKLVLPAMPLVFSAGLDTTVIEVVEHVAQVEPSEPAPTVSRPSRLPLTAAGLALALVTGVTLHAWLDRAPPVVATPLAFPVEAPKLVPAPVAPAVVPPPVVTPVVAPVVEAPKEPRRRRAREPEREAVETPRERAKPRGEEQLVLHEPEVLFYDEEDVTADPRIGVPVNPF
ncbi:MAG: protein kinase [Polyangiales bacterium]